MHSATLKTQSLIPPSCSCFIRLSKFTNPNSRWIQLKGKKENDRKLFLKSLKCIDSNINSSTLYPLKSNNRNPKSSVSCSAVTVNVADKLQSLVSEFKSLSEPIDRVKRLLHYAALLPPFDESARVPVNRVMGCTTQVWLETSMDGNGVMRFRADSDSEITKGFSSCLIWLLDGAAPAEVLELNTEDLADMNVGLLGRAHSRVNTWHNILISMQKRTKTLVAEREKQPLEFFPSLVVTTDDITAKGSYAEARVKVKEHFNVMNEKKIGSVAHIIRIQKSSVLTAAQKLWPHAHISDSLTMTDFAVNWQNVDANLSVP